MDWMAARDTAAIRLARALPRGALPGGDMPLLCRYSAVALSLLCRRAVVTLPPRCRSSAVALSLLCRCSDTLQIATARHTLENCPGCHVLKRHFHTMTASPASSEKGVSVTFSPSTDPENITNLPPTCSQPKRGRDVVLVRRRALLERARAERSLATGGASRLGSVQVGRPWRTLRGVT